MEVRYKRDLNSNYMILKGKANWEENYEVPMITENRIPGLLSCIMQKQNEHVEYYYEITGSQSMALLYERRKMGYEQLCNLMRELERILESSSEYLLSPNHIVLKPEYMYLYSKSEKLRLCYYPGYEKPIRESFLEWAEYLLGKLDKNDTQGIEFGYELYQNALEPNFSLLESLKKRTRTEVKREEKLITSVIEDIPITPEEIFDKTGTWKTFFKKKNKKSQLEDYVAEESEFEQSSVLFMKEDDVMDNTAFLKEQKREGLFLKSKNVEYPDFHMLGESFLIGKRGEGVDACIPAATISRLHARITFDGTRYYLEDLNSSNGTWADQIQLNPYELFPLENGMRIVFASAEYEVEL